MPGAVLPRRTALILIVATAEAALLVASIGNVLVAGDPAQLGQFQIFDAGLALTPVHAALLRTGKVWIGTRAGNGPNNPPPGIFRSYVLDPLTRTASETETPPWNLFCSGHAFLADGTLLIAGGTKEHPPNWPGTFDLGTSEAYLFDPISETYKQLPQMRDGRWYPTLVTLADGQVYTIGGKDPTGKSMNTIPEIFEASSQTWTELPQTDPWPMYPHMFLTEGGRLFYTGGNVFSGTFGLNLPPPGFLDAQTGALSPVTGLTRPADRDQSASVLLPPAQDQRVMIMGGGVRGANSTIDNVDIIDLDNPNPSYTAAPHLIHARMHLNAVLLPDRTVFVTGGDSSEEMTPVHESEIYDPQKNTWSAAATSQVGRMYHSFALLLPDGRVLVGGSNPPGMEAQAELRLELYSPPYLFAGPRPTISQAPAEVGYGTKFQISTTQASDIKWVNLMRPSAVTHSMDTEQRVVDVSFELAASGNLEVTLPTDATIAPPGWYMLTVTNRDNVPSEAAWIRLG